MNYSEIQEKYTKANIDNYKFQNADEVKAVLGFDFRTMRGFKDLTEDHQRLAEWLICKYINGWGLEAREEIRPSNIKRASGGFKVTFKDKGYSYLFDTGSIG